VNCAWFTESGAKRQAEIKFPGMLNKRNSSSWMLEILNFQHTGKLTQRLSCLATKLEASGERDAHCLAINFQL
jgi:hypothetical protein